MIQVLRFPDIKPFLIGPFGPFEIFGHYIGPLGVRWYALAYITALVVGWRLVRRFVALAPAVATPVQVDDFLTWATLGVVLGGRVGYVLFYLPKVYLADPAMILAVWEGGMSFHGGMLGVAIAIVVFCRRHAIPILGFADRIAIVAPIGLGLGRCANFVNGELWGRPAPLWWPGTVVFPGATPVEPPSLETYEMLRQTVCAGLDPSQCVPRYPSQLYEALLEGAVLFVLMFVLSRRAGLRSRFGLLTGIFLAGYAIARIIGECFREPDSFRGFLTFGTTTGQLLSIPMLLVGLWLMIRVRPHDGTLR
jgi:phosphatidylglycerol:prolipoprotein diacylglycerol transferase